MFCPSRNPDHGGRRDRPTTGSRSRQSAVPAIALLLAVMLIAICGCQTPIHREPPLNQPRISDLRKEVPAVWSNDLLRPAFPQVNAHVRLLWFHERANLEEAVELIETDSLPASTTARWRSNGLRIGTIATDEASWQRFVDLLPVPIRHRQMNTSMGLNDDEERRLILRMPLPPRSTVDLLDASATPQSIDAQTVESHPTHGAQLFARVSGSSANDLTLHLMPHLHQPRARFFDEGHLERERYGAWLKTLETRWPVGSDRLLIILYDPWPEEQRPPKDDPGPSEQDRPPSIFGRDIRSPAPGTRGPPEDPDSPETHPDGASAEENDEAFFPGDDEDGRPDRDDASQPQAPQETDNEPELEKRPFRFGDGLLQHRAGEVTLRGMLIFHIPPGPIRR